MIKHLPIQKSSGYTIIEIIIAVLIMAILFSAVQANYRQNILLKNLESAKSMVIDDIKLAQESALAGKKPSTCTGLNGYIFATNVTNNNYTISAYCNTPVVIKTVDISKLAKGINIGSNISVLFKVMGMGTNIPAGNNVSFNLVQQTTGSIVTITISSGGDIK